jgi:hypothetical protein
MIILTPGFRQEENKIMGIAFSHCNASWAYSGFGRFREKLWNSCGFYGDLYKLYDNDKFLKQIKKDHPLFDFFNHSDCDGKLTPDQLKKIIPALKNILLYWCKDDFDKIEGEELIKGMEVALSKNESLIFM